MILYMWLSHLCQKCSWYGMMLLLCRFLRNLISIDKIWLQGLFFVESIQSRSVKHFETQSDDNVLYIKELQHQLNFTNFFDNTKCGFISPSKPEFVCDMNLSFKFHYSCLKYKKSIQIETLSLVIFSTFAMHSDHCGHYFFLFNIVIYEMHLLLFCNDVCLLLLI